MAGMTRRVTCVRHFVTLNYVLVCGSLSISPTSTWDPENRDFVVSYLPLLFQHSAQGLTNV